MGGAKLLKWRLAAEGAKLLKSGAALILRTPGWRGRKKGVPSSDFTQRTKGKVVKFRRLAVAKPTGSHGRST